jgi:hypothetical protein
LQDEKCPPGDKAEPRLPSPSLADRPTSAGTKGDVERGTNPDKDHKPISESRSKQVVDRALVRLIECLTIGRNGWTESDVISFDQFSAAVLRYGKVERGIGRPRVDLGLIAAKLGKRPGLGLVQLHDEDAQQFVEKIWNAKPEADRTLRDLITACAEFFQDGTPTKASAKQIAERILRRRGRAP